MTLGEATNSQTSGEMDKETGKARNGAVTGSKRSPQTLKKPLGKQDQYKSLRRGDFKSLRAGQFDSFKANHGIVEVQEVDEQAVLGEEGSVQYEGDEKSDLNEDLNVNSSSSNSNNNSNSMRKGSHGKRGPLHLNLGKEDDHVMPCPSPRFEIVHGNAKKRVALVNTLESVTNIISDVNRVSNITKQNVHSFDAVLKQQQLASVRALQILHDDEEDVVGLKNIDLSMKNSSHSNNNNNVDQLQTRVEQLEAEKVELAMKHKDQFELLQGEHDQLKLEYENQTELLQQKNDELKRLELENETMRQQLSSTSKNESNNNKTSAGDNNNREQDDDVDDEQRRNVDGAESEDDNTKPKSRRQKLKQKAYAFVSYITSYWSKSGED